MLTPEQIAEIRERHADLPTGILPDWVSCDIAALLDHCDELRAKYIRVVNQVTSAAEELGGYYAALTPEVVETLCEACDEAMMAATEEADNAYHRQARMDNALMRHDQFAAARAALESLK